MENTQQAPKSTFEFDALRLAENYRRALVKEFSPQLKGNVIEIGSGIGQMSKLLQKIPTISSLQCIEPDADFCKTFRADMPGQNLIEGTIRDIKTDNWNAIVSVNVLEHIEDDRGELKMYYDLLKKEKGTVILFIPARPELYAPIDKDFGHFRRYTKKDIRKKLEDAGFKIEKMRYFNIVGYVAWWLMFRIMKQRVFKDASVKLFDRVIFPVVYFIESRFIAPPIGQSIIVTARAK